MPGLLGAVAAEEDDEEQESEEEEDPAVRATRLLDEMRRGEVLYDYHQTWGSTLGVRKGDIVTILDVSSDPKWWLVADDTKEDAVGWLPKQFVRHQPWTHAAAHLQT